MPDIFVRRVIFSYLSGQGYAILSREQPKVFRLSDKTVLGSTGCWCDILTFCKVSFYLLRDIILQYGTGIIL
jgi:hypothetical protein